MSGRARRWMTGVVCALALIGGGPAAAQAAAPEPIFTLVGPLINPVQNTSLELEDACGLAVGSVSNSFYLSNYYLHLVNLINPPVPPNKPMEFSTLLGNVDSLDGPCGLAPDNLGRIYVNNYHRNIERYSLSGGVFQTPTVIDSSHPTGVAVNLTTNNVYVDDRTYVAVYDSSGAPVLDGGNPLKIGVGSLEDGYGLAVSAYPGTAGRIYVADHSDDTLKVYDPVVSKVSPVQVITGPPGGFGSLRDSAIAIDRVTGEVFVADTIAHPQYLERPEAVIRVFDASGAYKGRLKYAIVDPEPPGIAVDNTVGTTQGRVYVTSGNSIRSGVYVYPPGSATSESAPGLFALAASTVGAGQGTVQSAPNGIDCDSSCEAPFLPKSQVTLTATPDPGSSFVGWSGGGCSGTGPCTVAMDAARSVNARFEELAGPPAAASSTPTGPVIVQKGNLRLSVSGKLAPKRLPRKGSAPISVSVGGEISTTDQSLPPQLETIQIELNRQGRIDASGLPACRYSAIQPGSSDRALSACRASLVGRGSFTADITLSGQEPYPTSGKLLLFHAMEAGKPVLYGHIYSPKPFATSFVIVFAVKKVSKGTYGTALTATLPKAMEAWGRLTGLQMKLFRQYTHKGESHSFLSAGCPAPKGFTAAVFLLARTEFSFAGGAKLGSTLPGQCTVRG
jgi:hypothetical protein